MFCIFSYRNLGRLRELDVGNNQIRVLHSDSFGASLNSLSFLMADNNLIEMIDEELFDNSSSLQYLYLNRNKCVNRNYFGIGNNRNGTRLDLQRCFDNFNRAVPLSCIYLEFPGEYTCYMSADLNLSGNDNTEVIDGVHVDGRTNTDVIALESYNQHIRTVPSVICRQFPNLNSIWLSFNRIQTFRQTSFAECANLRELVLEVNPIHILPAGLFVSNAVLQTLWLDSNRIFSIENGNSFFFEKSI